MNIPNFREIGTKLPKIPEKNEYRYEGWKDTEPNSHLYGEPAYLETSRGFKNHKGEVYILCGNGTSIAEGGCYMIKENDIIRLWEEQNPEPEFVLPENWYVVVTEENQKILSKWRFEGSHMIPVGFIVGMVKWSSGNTEKSHNPPKFISGENEYDFGVEITTEQFCKYVLKETEDKKILIGYKCPIDLLKGRIKKGSIFSEYSKDGFVMYNSEHLTSGVPTEIVQTWEPVFKEKDTILYFGKVSFTLDKSRKSYKTIHGEVTLEELNKAIEYLSNPPKLCGYSLKIYVNGVGHYLYTDTKYAFNIGFGCEPGTYRELIALRDELINL